MYIRKVMMPPIADDIIVDVSFSAPSSSHLMVVMLISFLLWDIFLISVSTSGSILSRFERLFSFSLFATSERVELM